MNLRGNGNTLAYYYRALSYKAQGNKTRAIDDLRKLIDQTDDPQWIMVAEQQIKEVSGLT